MFSDTGLECDVSKRCFPLGTTEVKEPQRQDKTSQIHVSNPDMARLQNARPSGNRIHWLRTSLRA